MGDECTMDCDLKEKIASIETKQDDMHGDIKCLLRHHNEREGARKVLINIGKGTAVILGIAASAFGVYKGR